MSANRSEDRAYLCFFTFVDGRRCRIARRHGPCAHAGKSATPVPSMIYFTTSGYRGWGTAQESHYPFSQRINGRHGGRRQPEMPLSALEATLTTNSRNY
jgi:hypothetical protein